MTRYQVVTLLYIIAAVGGLVYVAYNFLYAPRKEFNEVRQAAIAGDAAAQAHLGDMYLFCSHTFRSPAKIIQRRGWGSGLEKWAFLGMCNLPEGEKWYRASAEGGDIQGQFGYGLWLAYGRQYNIDKKSAESKKWLEKSASRGHIEAAYFLRLFSKPEPKKAFKWLQLAALKNHAGAQSELADLYEQGIGVKKNIEEAYFWSLVALQNGYGSYPAIKKRYYSKLSDEKKASIIGRAQNWTAKK